MAYYDALIAKWATLNGTTAQKLAAINAATVVGTRQPAIVAVNAIVNAIVPADLLALTTNPLLVLQIILAGNTSVDASPGTTVRSVFQTIFAGKAATLAALNALVQPFDNPPIFWWQATIAQGGGALAGPVSQGDLDAAGLS